MRLTVAAKKILQAEHVRSVRPPNQNRSADTGFDVGDAAQDQRAHDAFAEFCFGNDQCTHLVRQNKDRFDIFIRIGVDNGVTAGQ
jgi:hypothetical protein